MIKLIVGFYTILDEILKISQLKKRSHFTADQNMGSNIVINMLKY